MRAAPLVFASCALAAACGCSSSGSAATAGSSGDASTPGSGEGGAPDAAVDSATADAGPPIGGDRPVTLYVPPSYAPGKSMPLVVGLHGYGSNAAQQEAYFNLKPQADARGFLYAMPEGTVNAIGQQFWNATDACCDVSGSGVDDSGYVSRVIDEIKSRYSVDAKRVYVIGHSNGGFMGFRMACDHADQIAAVVTLAGAMYVDVTKCAPSGPVAQLHIHGDADTTNPFGGGALVTGAPIPSAMQSVQDWVTLNGCDGAVDSSSPNLDLVSTLPGAETSVGKYTSGCKPAGRVEFWKMAGAGHSPRWTPAFAPAVIDFLLAQSKP